mmetsp:Transcript_32297/g.77432  ORF Transcript_32297/g.77432 Transcript_32297/m.77432 type:complete len:271 (+) Transcript_32297:324-1136(+)
MGLLDRHRQQLLAGLHKLGGQRPQGDLQRDRTSCLLRRPHHARVGQLHGRAPDGLPCLVLHGLDHRVTRIPPKPTLVLVQSVELGLLDLGPFLGVFGIVPPPHHSHGLSADGHHLLGRLGVRRSERSYCCQASSGDNRILHRLQSPLIQAEAFQRGEDGLGLFRAVLRQLLVPRQPLAIRSCPNGEKLLGGCVSLVRVVPCGGLHGPHSGILAVVDGPTTQLLHDVVSDAPDVATHPMLHGSVSVLLELGVRRARQRVLGRLVLGRGSGV